MVERTASWALSVLVLQQTRHSPICDKGVSQCLSGTALRLCRVDLHADERLVLVSAEPFFPCRGIQESSDILAQWPSGSLCIT